MWCHYDYGRSSEAFGGSSQVHTWNGVIVRSFPNWAAHVLLALIHLVHLVLLVTGQVHQAGDGALSRTANEVSLQLKRLINNLFVFCIL